MFCQFLRLLCQNIESCVAPFSQCSTSVPVFELLSYRCASSPDRSRPPSFEENSEQTLTRTEVHRLKRAEVILELERRGIKPDPTYRVEELKALLLREVPPVSKKSTSSDFPPSLPKNELMKLATQKGITVPAEATCGEIMLLMKERTDDKKTKVEPQTMEAQSVLKRRRGTSVILVDVLCLWKFLLRSLMFLTR